ncbi:alpha,alpha-trehalase TreA [Chitinophaga pendula]|nr:alpha,alpha-trehalase TreA [Chitinophaga pendula]
MLICLTTGIWAQRPPTPDQVYGELFTAVQSARVFPDSKTFVDAVPKQTPAQILQAYQSAKNQQGFNLRSFVMTHFDIPGTATPVNKDQTQPVTAHIQQLWSTLKRSPAAQQTNSSLLPLPHPYIVPGGRFREIYYWDSYFTMQGLRVSGEISTISDMVSNFAALIANYGHIPNGNRTYFLSRSQPPFFSAMVELLAAEKGDSIYKAYLPALQQEYDYWMDRSAPTQHVVHMPDGSLLNRYYDQDSIPRQESYREDIATAAGVTHPATLYRDLRSAAESGWDFSSRWQSDPKDLRTTRTTALVPVDLNALLYHLETTLAKASRIAGNTKDEARFRALATARRRSLEKYCWSTEKGWYVDYDIEKGKPADALTLAGMYPFFFRMADKKHIQQVSQQIRHSFLQAGGLTTTLQHTGEQWDAPNGWAPLQWISIQGLEKYGQSALARDIAQRWAKLNIQVYQQTGKLMEKYNVVDMTLTAGGGEYPSQDGFGWTNGVLLALMKQYGIQEPPRQTIKGKPAVL